METQPYSTRVKAPTSIIPDVDASSSNNGSYEDVPANLPGTSTSNCRNGAGKNNVKYMNCRNEKVVSVFNVRSLRLPNKRLELASNFINKGIDILGIVDHKIVHEDQEDPIRSEQLEKCTLITSTAWRNTSQAACGGVGMMISKSAEKSLSDIIPYNNRILIAHFNGNPATTIIVHYSPVEGNDEAIEHYTNLAAAIDSIPKHNMLMVIGDCNAHLGTEDVCHTFHQATNTNGKLLLELAMESNLIITNTTFQKRPGKLWTFISDMSGRKTQIDYILVNKKWKNSIKNVEAYSSFASIGSDHRILSARVKLSLRTSKTPARKDAYEWSALSNSDLQTQYSVSIRNRFNELRNETETATERYGHLILANEDTAKLLLPTKQKRSRKNISNDPRVELARQNVNEAFKTYQLLSMEENREKLKGEKALLEEAYNKVTEEDLDNMIKRVENANNNHQHAESWKLINEISGRKSAKKGLIKGDSQEDRLQKWYTHFSQLLGSEPTLSDEHEEVTSLFPEQDINTGSFTIDEYQPVKKKLVGGKSSGADGIPPEVLKLCDLDDIIIGFANGVLIEGEKPQQWSLIDIIPLPKSGDLGLTSNYRGISLTSIASKVTNKMILNRIQPYVEPLLRPNQNGFRPGRSTTAHILALRRIIEGVKRKNLKAIALFVDFKKAFDSIHRGKMMKILLAYGIPEQLVNAISLLYEGTKAKVLTPDGETDIFEIHAGVLQGDTLAPYLFVIVIDYVMRRAIGDDAEEIGFRVHIRKSRRKPPVIVTDLMFADDIALLSEEIHQTQTLLDRVEMEAAKVGLHINVKKTELMAYNQNGPVSVKTRTGKTLKVVENFKYLGAWMASSEKDINVRKALAWQACHKLTKIWKSSLSRKIKIRLFQATVESVLLYGCETWTLTKKLEKQLDGMYTRMLRMVLNISWKSHTTNIVLYGGLPKLTEKIAKRRMRLAGHCVRHPEEIASDLVLWQPTHGHVNRGRATTTYTDMLLRDTGLASTSEIQTAMLERHIWRGYVSLVRSEDRPR